MAVLANLLKAFWCFQSEMARTAKDAQILQRIISGNAPRNNMMDDQTRSSAAFCASISIPYQDRFAKSQPSFGLKALPYRSPFLRLDKGDVFAPTWIGTGLRFLNPGRDDLIGRTANEALQYDPGLRFSCTLEAAKTRSSLRRTRRNIKGLLAGITNQMYTLILPSTPTRAEFTTSACHGCLIHRERMKAISTCQRDVGFWSFSRTHSSIIAQESYIGCAG